MSRSVLPAGPHYNADYRTRDTSSAGWVSRDPKALAEAREKLSLSFVII